MSPLRITSRACKLAGIVFLVASALFYAAPQGVFAQAATDPNVPAEAEKSVGPGETPAPERSAPVPATPVSATPIPAAPQPTATPVPLLVRPASVSLPAGGSAFLQAQGVFGNLRATVANGQIVAAIPNQDDRTIRLQGFALGSTTVTLTDDRGQSFAVDVTVAPLAGHVAPFVTAQITGSPASALFAGEVAERAAVNAAAAVPGGTVTVGHASVHTKALDEDTIADVTVPVTVTAANAISVSGITTVHLENVAEPPVKPTSLIVSDFPERLTSAGLLFTSTLQPQTPTRMMFYHYNPAHQPNRHIVLRAQNHGETAATVQLIDGHGGPSGNEMMVGHLAAERFLVRSQQNEGQLTAIPAHSVITLVDAPLPAGTIVNDMMQLREISGTPVQLTLTAEDEGVPALPGDGTGPLLTAAEHHARGIYPIPQFFYETTYVVGGDPLSIPVGQLPLPNLRQGEALVGDYGVELTIDATLSNPTSTAEPVAIYANPRGGRATGTFLIDRTLVQSHALRSFTNYKLRQYIVPPHGLVNVEVVTIPEGGSSYPVNLIFAPDDGSVAPGAPGSPVY